MATGLAPLARPTARLAFGAPSVAARRPYVVVVPARIVLNAVQTRRWKAVPPVRTGMVSNAASSPSK